MISSSRLRWALILVALVLLAVAARKLYRAVQRTPLDRYPYSTAVELPDDLPAPESVSISVLRQIALLPCFLPKEDERMAAENALSRTLPSAAVVVSDPPSEYPEIAESFRTTLARAEKGQLEVPPGGGLSVLAVGPVLMPYDGVEVRDLTCRGDRIDMKIVYTALPPGEKWNVKVESRRPMVVVPLLLEAGAYRLKVTWQQVDNVKEGKELPGKSQTQACSFLAPEGMVKSQALRVHGADFQMLADGRCRVPAAGRRAALHFGLRIINRGESDLLFDPSGMRVLSDSLRAADDSDLHYWGGADGTMIAKPVRVRAGCGHVFMIRGELGWLRDVPFRGVGRARGDKGFYLSGVTGSGDMFWGYDGLTVGRYSLSLDYHVSSRPPTYWTGDVRSKDVQVEIMPPE